MREIVIFIIDDDELYLAQLSQRLSTGSSVSVTTFPSVEKAMSEIDQLPHIILLDHALKGVNGADAIPMLKKESPSSNVVLMTGQSEVEVAATAMRNGASQFLRKDISIVRNITKVIREIDVNDSSNNGIMNRFHSLLQQTSKWHPEVIFVVEDEEIFAQAIKFTLVKVFPQAKIFLYHDGGAAIKAMSTPPDLVILDYQLGYVKGDKVLGEINELAKDVKVVMLSGQEDLDVALNLFELGIDDYIVKNPTWKETFSNVIKNYVSA